MVVVVVVVADYRCSFLSQANLRECNDRFGTL